MQTVTLPSQNPNIAGTFGVYGNNPIDNVSVSGFAFGPQTQYANTTSAGTTENFAIGVVVGIVALVLIGYLTRKHEVFREALKEKTLAHYGVFAIELVVIINIIKVLANKFGTIPVLTGLVNNT